MSFFKLLFLLFLSTKSFALTDVQVNRLDLLNKTWNVGKMFHSGACNLNWDDALLNSIPEVIQATDDVAFNTSINSLLDLLGDNQVSEESIPETLDFLKQHQDTTWLSNGILSSETSKRISTIIAEFRPREYCFTSVYTNNEDALFDADSGYYETEATTPELRLLALFRFWGIYNYFSPYKNIIDRPWKDSAKLSINEIYSSESERDFQEKLLLFIKYTDDSHGRLSNDDFNIYPEKYLPFYLKTVEGRLVVFYSTDHYPEVKKGDIVISIDDKTVDKLRVKYANYFSYSNLATKVRLIDILMNGVKNDFAKLKLKNSKDEVYEVIVDYSQNKLHKKGASQWYSLDQETCSIGYVNMGLLERDNVDAMMAEFMNKDAIVFDVRSYPRGTIYQLRDYLFPEAINMANFSYPIIDYPGAWGYAQPYLGNGTQNPYDGRVLILMNAQTISHAEFTIMGLEQHPNAVKIGSQTAAADGNVSFVYLPGKNTAVFTGIGTYYSDNSTTQRVGLVPDLFVKPTLDNVRNGIDDVLEPALNCDNIRDLNWPVAPKPKSGLFWDPKHSGTGNDIAEVGNNYTVIPYNYREDGSPVWYLGVAETNDGVVNLLESSMNEFKFDTDTGITTINLDTAITFDFKRGPQETQCASEYQELKSFPSQMTWRLYGETTKLCEEEFIFASGEPEIDFTGLWWGGETESGWGVSINTQGNKIVTIVYFYDEDGKALWLLGSADFDTENPTTIDLKKFSYCPTCSDNQYPSQDVAILTLSLKQSTSEFNDDNWLSLSFGDSIWNRDHMPIKIFSNLQE